MAQRDQIQYDQLQLCSLEVQNFKSFEGHHVIGPCLSFTAIVGPNGGGKSNILDGIAFCLLLKHISKKHKHLNELIYREEHENYKENRREMSVKLNFKAVQILSGQTQEFSLKRMINANGIQEYFFNNQPLLAEEYLMKINDYHLNINNFCAYQGKLEELCFRQEGQHLVQMFEELSGSLQFKPQCDQLNQKIAKCDDQIKDDTEILHNLRIEKVKLKGLQDFVEQMKDCLQQQKEIESQLHFSDILLSEKNIRYYDEQLSTYTNSFQETIQMRQDVLNEMRKQEAEMKKLQNQEENTQKKLKSKKDELLSMQSNQFNKQKEIDSTKNMITQKRNMLHQFQSEVDQVQQKIKENRQSIEASRQKLNTINEQMIDNEDLKMQDSIRDEYLTIKSKIESENAQIGRQMALIEQKINYLNQRKANFQGQIYQQKNQNSKVLDFEHQQIEINELKKEQKAKEQELKQLHSSLAQLKDQQVNNKDSIKVLEKTLLEKEYELKDFENEKQLKSQDVKLSQILEELKKRCKGYLGQLYELIKPINAQYDIAVKVALSKCLRFLVVDTPQTAEYCTEFLKEKGLFKDVLVLSNVPERHLNSKLVKDIKQDGNLVYDVLEVSRRHQHLDKAIRYFVADKVVCKNFDTAIKLQRMGVKDIVTEDGTEFKQGMISGGQHTNIFNLNLGNFKMDRDIKRLVDEISNLEQKLNALKEVENGDNGILKVMRDISRVETEVELIKQKIVEKDKETKNYKEAQSDFQKSVQTLEKQIQEIQKQLDQATSTKDDLQRDLSEAQTDAYSKFVQRLGFKSIQDYENSQQNQQVSSLNEEKNKLLQTISQCEKEIEFLERNDNFKSMQALEAVLKQEEDKLHSLISGQYHGDMVQKLQVEIKDLDSEIQLIKKNIQDVNSKQMSQKSQNESLQNRLEHFQKEININKIQLKNEQLVKQARFEEAQLSHMIENNANDISQLDFNHKLGIENIDEITIEEVQELIAIKKEKLRKLKLKEDEFNKNAALVPESDPNVALINDKITQLKDNVDKLSQEKQQYVSELKKLSEQRLNLFLMFFDNVASIINDVYAELTVKDSNLNQGGKISIFIEDRSNPFQKNIHFFPMPPSKSHIYDVSQLSGGEKTVAALALIFALIQVRKPPLLILDEVDAFLDQENVHLVTGFIKNKLKTQVLIISHKEIVIKHTDSLIGASFSKDQRTSLTHSLDLRKYLDK
ncbi:structural maintenance of chromosomes 1 [Stylonychia lemnae]|uniref:Structural maintenance of chromosomes protein n=1 Tax=Stylonychia lemnae TaxID=5949 RepID=A0A078B464_STYLE|nr:structural maintenance of chromosomes 1 [Stylonychia lemnae]|eukprot:CDW87992.1 structural maintenance of chromosomes 1 [Stylonychia lemnae]